MTKTIPYPSDGFLSPEFLAIAENTKDANYTWLELANEINRFGERLLALVTPSHTVGSPPDAKLAAYLITLRNMSNFQAMLLLAERGMLVEMRVLTRCCLENYLYCLALLNQPEKTINVIVASEKWNKRGLAEQLMKPKYKKRMKPEIVSEIQALAKTLKDEKREATKMQEIAAYGGNDELYAVYKMFSQDAVHLSESSLSRYLGPVPVSGRYGALEVGPQQDNPETPDTFRWACLATFGVCYSLCVLYELNDLQDEVSGFADKMEALSQTVPSQAFFTRSIAELYLTREVS